ncbi:RNA polymerase sigma factor SigW [Bacillaceae bacterium W0354]
MDIWLSQQIKQIKKGNHEAFGVIVDQYQNQIYQHCYRMLGNHHDAQEITQEAFLKAYANIHTFKKNKKFAPWLYRIASNLCIDYLRKKKPINILDQEIKGSEQITLLDQLESKFDSPDTAYEQLEHRELIQSYLLTLPDKYRSVIVLKYIQEMSLQEISETLDLPMGTVKTHLHRAREALRKSIRELSGS